MSLLQKMDIQDKGTKMARSPDGVERFIMKAIWTTMILLMAVSTGCASSRVYQSQFGRVESSPRIGFLLVDQSGRPTNTWEKLHLYEGMGTFVKHGNIVALNDVNVKSILGHATSGSFFRNPSETAPLLIQKQDPEVFSTLLEYCKERKIDYLMVLNIKVRTARDYLLKAALYRTSDLSVVSYKYHDINQWARWCAGTAVLGFWNPPIWAAICGVAAAPPGFEKEKMEIELVTETVEEFLGIRAPRTRSQIILPPLQQKAYGVVKD